MITLEVIIRKIVTLSFVPISFLGNSKKAQQLLYLCTLDSDDNQLLLCLRFWGTKKTVFGPLKVVVKQTFQFMFSPEKKSATGKKVQFVQATAPIFFHENVVVL